MLKASDGKIFIMAQLQIDCYDMMQVYVSKKIIRLSPCVHINLSRWKTLYTYTKDTDRLKPTATYPNFKASRFVYA